MRKNRKKVIYVYWEINNPGKYKIGKADQRQDQPDSISAEEIAQVRIAEQMTAATHGEYQIAAVYDISRVDNSEIVERAIHKAIELEGFNRLSRKMDTKKGSTEWFDLSELTEGEVLELIKNLVERFAGGSGLSTYEPRFYQSFIKSEVMEALDNGANIIGAELAARFGKTLWTLDVFRTLTEERGFQYLILPAYVLTALTSFQKELRSFSDFDDMLFITDKDDNFEEKINNNVDKKLVIGVSLHTPEESLGKYKAVAALDPKKKIAFIDEADFGAHTESSKYRLDLLEVPTKILMTGTAIERAVAGYEVDKILKWSYLDMLLLKDNNHPILDSLPKEERQAAVDTCISVVRPKFFKMVLPNASAIQESLPDVLQTKWSKLLEDVDKSQMILSMILRAMFKNDNSNILELSSLQLGSVTPANVTMVFGSFKNKIQHNKFIKLAQATLGEDFVVVTVNGDETSNRQAEEAVKKVVAKAKRAGKKVLIVSKDMASRSFSIPEIDTVFLMYDNGLLSQTVQKASRVFTPGDTYIGEDKVEGVVVSLSLDSNRTEIDPVDLYIVAEANRINNGEESFQESLRRVCNSVNIFQNDLTFGSILVDPDSYAETLLSRSNILKDIAASISLENMDLSKYTSGLLDNRSSSTSGSYSENVTVDISNVRTAVVEREEKERAPISPNLEKQLLQNIFFMINNITALSDIEGYSSGSLESTLQSIEEQNLQQEVESTYGISFGTIKSLVEDDVVPVRLLNTVLDGYAPEVLELF